MAKKLGKTVFVGVSGGVDSSVAAAMLKDQGYDVVGVFIRTWTPDFIDCTWRDERRDAMRVCAHLDIPFLECDAEDAYKKGVADYMIEEYKKGNTPNPDVMCNREVKFGVFWNFAKAHGADYIATGHYALVSENSNSFREATGVGARRAYSRGRDKKLREKLFELKRSPDDSKDQSYFLWTLTQDDLSHTLFPIGHMQKSEVRKLAEKYKLPTATKKDSQGVCFLGPLDMKEFLKHYIKPEKGEVLDERGQTIGHHDGAVFFTLGERHGFTISKNSNEDAPLYVVAKDIKKNTITVGSNKHFTPKGTDNFLLEISSARASRPAQDLSDQNVCYRLLQTNWISGLPTQNKKYTAQVRYHGEQLPCRVEGSSVIFDKPTLISPGQSIVIYDDDVCIGGGVVI